MDGCVGGGGGRVGGQRYYIAVVLVCTSTYAVATLDQSAAVPCYTCSVCANLTKTAATAAVPSWQPGYYTVR